ncbi:hypothetical protein NUW54_g8517 [Trametes sanguinea]|uniref:Uncharacterized protein n=1 Tax=Trametes sanguinea TaxID=158606 RepID=A0ACC1PCX1_9APHY|nr:hypothetical protein NUW54_g8517 [Trametes sanguinea]
MLKQHTPIPSAQGIIPPGLQDHPEIPRSPSVDLAPNASIDSDTFVPEVDDNGWYVNKPRQQAHFPKVPFWRKREWHDAEKAAKVSTIPGEERGKRGPTRMAQGENIALRFITDADGNPVDGQRAQTIRRRFREFCVYLHNNNMAPPTWQRGVNTEIVTAYHHWMRTQCFELQLCEDNWKADKVAILSNYTQWKKKFEARIARAEEAARLAAKKNKKKKRHAAVTTGPVVPTTDDAEAQEDILGAKNVGYVLGRTELLRLSPVPGQPESMEGDVATGTSVRPRALPETSDGEPAPKRTRTDSATPQFSPSPTPDDTISIVIPSIEPMSQADVLNTDSSTSLQPGREILAPTPKIFLPNPL